MAIPPTMYWCDAPQCEASGFSAVDHKTSPAAFKLGVRAKGWWCVEILDTPAPTKILCPVHVSLAPTRRETLGA